MVSSWEQKKNQPTEYRTMTQKRVSRGTKEIKAMVTEDVDFLRPLVRSVIQEFLEAEMTAAVGAEKGERVEGRWSYRSGYYPRSLITGVGKLELRVPQERNGRFSTEIFEPYQRSERRYGYFQNQGLTSSSASESVFSASAISLPASGPSSRCIARRRCAKQAENSRSRNCRLRTSLTLSRCARSKKGVSTPDRDPPERYEKERNEMRQKTEGELLKIRATTGNLYTRDLADAELRHREYVRNVLPDRRRSWIAIGISILALAVSAVALFKPEFRSWIFQFCESLPFAR
jgi:Transposase, Mutator family